MAVYWLGSILRFCGWEEVKVNIDAKTDEAWISSYLDWTTGAIKDLSHGQERKLFLAWPLLEISSGQDGPIQSEHMICFIFPTCGFSHVINTCIYKYWFLMTLLVIEWELIFEEFGIWGLCFRPNGLILPSVVMFFVGFWDWFETVVSLFNVEILLSVHARISEADILHLE